MKMVPLCSVEIDLGERYAVGGKAFGERLIGEFLGCRWKGERFNAKMIGAAAADWCVVGATGLFDVSVRVTLETDDGHLVYVHYEGLMDTAAEGAPIRTAIRFETAAEPYQWLTRTLSVGDGHFDEPNKLITYDVYVLE